MWAGLMQGPAGFRKQVAVKLVEPGKGDEEVLRREARLGAMMRHGNLVDVYELGRADDGRWFLAMELVPGPTLREVLRTLGALPGTALREIAIQLCRGLAYAHALPIEADTVGLVHRDIKPSNVLLDPSGMVKLSDFGIARLHDGATTDVQGTPGYIAPEQLQGAAPDPRADVYGMGILLWAMAIGRPPLRPGKGRAKVLEAALGAQVRARAARALLSEALPGLDQVVERCLDPDPGLRFADARDLGRALRALPEPPGQGLLELMRHYEAQRRPDDPGDDSPTRTTASFHSTGSALPRVEAPLLGRDRELEALQAQLEPAGAWVTLKGLPGIGKTRLAQHLAHRWAAGARPVVWVELTGAHDRIAMLSRVGEALRLTESHDARSIARALATRTEGLLVLDAIDGLTDELRSLIPALRATAPWLRLLLTGRSVVRHGDEVVLELGPLDSEAARRLYAERLPEEATAPAAHILDAILAGLEGVPLTIELAATQALDDTGPGSLEEALATTWKQLPAWSQHALLQLTAFEGTFLVEAAEAVIDTHRWPDAPWPLDIVDDLWNRSLLYVRQGRGAQRMGMYGAVRQFALARTDQRSARRDAERRHGAWLARFGDEAWLDGLQLRGGEARVRELARELDDLVAACRRAVERNDTRVAEATALAAWEVLRRRGPLDRVPQLLEPVLGLNGLTREAALRTALATVAEATEAYDAALEASRTPRERATTLAALARHLHLKNDLEGSVQRAHEALELATEVNDRVVEGRALIALGAAERKLGQPEASEAHLLDGLERLDRVGCVVDRSHAFQSLGNLYILQDRHDDAEAAFQKARRGYRATGMKGAMGTALANLSLVDRQRQDYASADRRAREALELHRAVGDRRGEINDLGQLANCRVSQGRLTEAIDALQETRLRARDAGMAKDEAVAAVNLGHCYTLLGRYDEALPHFEAAHALADRLRLVWLRALAGGNRAIALPALGRLDDARTAFDAAIADARQVGSRRMEGALLHERVRADLDAHGPDDLAEAERLLLAASDPIEHAKLRCTRARLLARRGDLEAARAELQGLDASDMNLAQRITEARAELRS